MEDKFRRNPEFSDEVPVYSRLFIVADKKITEAEFRKVFSEYGEIEDIRIPINEAGMSKGICFIKYAKTSAAAKAVEGMHLKVFPNTSRPMKVMVAINRTEVPTVDSDPQKYQRLFLHVPRTMKEEELDKVFEKYGNITSLIIQRHHDTGESKGFAYITYSKFSEAAQALEECPKHYRPIFAKPKTQRRLETPFEYGLDMLAKSSSSKASLLSMIDSRPSKYTSVNFMGCPYLTHNHVERLFDLIPGMIKCKYFFDIGLNAAKGTVTYSNPNSAAYAVEKLNEFEYPPGMPIFVKPNNSRFNNEENHFRNIPNALAKVKNAIQSSSTSGRSDLAELTAAIAEATKIIQMATGEATADNLPSNSDINYCSVELPPTQPLADIDSPLAKRCFLVCKPAPPPLTVLRDVFCRFGDLINVYTLPNKTVGYARYASVNAADAAIKTLHGAEICGVRMKVLEAEDEAPPRKRRYED